MSTYQKNLSQFDDDDDDGNSLLSTYYTYKFILENAETLNRPRSSESLLVNEMTSHAVISTIKNLIIISLGRMKTWALS